jgi:hypothetical protein
MTNIKLIIIGHSDKAVDFNVILKHKSKFFKYLEIEHINNIPKPIKDDGYLDIVYSSTEISTLLKDIKFDGLCFSVMNYRFDDNFYLHRVGNNKVCLSIFDIENILSKKEISIENFIIKNTYEMFLFYIIFNNLISDEVYSFVHDDTRGCLFDLNGDKKDIIYNTEQPIICPECKGKIHHKTIPKNLLEGIEKELQKIEKPFLKKAEIFIKKYPLVSILLTFVFSTFINLISNWIWKLIEK